MTTIKGPVVINRNNYAKILEEHNILVKMPFTATGFKSERIPDRADMTGITSESSRDIASGDVTIASKSYVAPVEKQVSPAEKLVSEVSAERGLVSVKSNKKEAKKKK
jgi:hypothetical protein